MFFFLGPFFFSAQIAMVMANELLKLWRQPELRPYSGVELVLRHHGGGQRECKVAVELGDWEVGGEGDLSEKKEFKGGS